VKVACSVSLGAVSFEQLIVLTRSIGFNLFVIHLANN